MKYLLPFGLLALCTSSALAAEAEDESRPEQSLPSAEASSAPGKPAPPRSFEAHDHTWDGGEKIDLFWKLSPDDKVDAEPKRVAYYKVLVSGEEDGHFTELLAVVPVSGEDWQLGGIRATIEKLERGEDYHFRLVAVAPDGTWSDYVEAGPVRPSRSVSDKDRWWIGGITGLLCGMIILWIYLARRGIPLKIRKIAGLAAVDEAVGRATEMGRSCLFVPGIQDMNDMQTIAGMTILGRVAATAAEYDARIEVPTSRSLVMTAARETVQASFLAAGRPDAFNEDSVYYVTDEQFGYVAYLSGMMVRDKPAACFYMGAFFAESLILAETGNSIGAIQVAGTAMPAQLPFFVAACDYTLIGEEFFAASAYLSGEPEQLGSLKGQDMGKIIAAVLLVLGCGVATLDALTGSSAIRTVLDYLKHSMLT